MPSVNFNPRSHEGSDVAFQPLNLFSRTNFNPRSHEGSDEMERKIRKILVISIHAPTRGATMAEIVSLSDLAISIHAPTRGATSGSYLCGANDDNFNPRSHEGSDKTSIKSRFAYMRFQSTLPRGERHKACEERFSLLLFQSTLPRGERQQFSPKSSLFSQQKLSKIFNLNNKLF